MPASFREPQYIVGRRAVNFFLRQNHHSPPFSGQSNGRSPIAHSLGGSPSAVFWYNRLPQTVQHQLLLTFVVWLGAPNALKPEAARSPCGGAVDGFPTNSRQALQGCITGSNESFRGIVPVSRSPVLVDPVDRPLVRELDCVGLTLELARVAGGAFDSLVGALRFS